MANQKIRNLTLFEQIDQRFAKGQVTAVVNFIDNLRFPVSMSVSGDTFEPEQTETQRRELYQNTDVFLDYGDGRVSKGLRGLELLSRLCKGVEPENLYLFNNVIYVSSPEEIKRADREQLVNIISANLGMTTILLNATPIAAKDSADFIDLCYRIGYTVRSGIFRRENFASQVLRLTKKLTVAASRNTGN